ncbi:DHA2 family efflux MFS transporter permease subunit [Sphingobium sp. LSP13-1-1.1]|uniref:DHA2 family efflux MFS transporter permease subunit n=1 Tax=Sphingobium sp. LSP13-1-1.1 TaxID=3135234 RepID=UPI003416660F
MSRPAETLTLLSPRHRLLAGLVLALSNFMVVLDLTIANVSVPHIAGNLGISADQGTWIITSYAVAEAICVPLTGWLAQRFGAVRLFTFGMLGFGLFSLLCGLSMTLGMIVACRIGQGLCGGPLMPMSQTLLMRVFPPEQRARVMGLWAMTTLLGPALGPIFGGYISDNWSWHWIFFINVPIAVVCVLATMALLRPVETPRVKLPIDYMGLGLLIFWIGCLQIMLDIGRDRDWFGDPLIVILAVFAAIGFCVFIIWELTEEHPIVDLRVFRHVGFTSGVFTLALCFGAYFAGIVVIPQWLQISMGYTAAWAGYATAFTAMTAILVAPIAGRLVNKVDVRIMISGSVAWIGIMTLWRAHWTTDADFWTIALPQLVQGFGMPLFMIPLTTLTLGSVRPEETASAAGMQNFLRTLAIAISTSIVLTGWGNGQRVSRNEMVGTLHPDATLADLTSRGFTQDQARQMIANMVDAQSMVVSMDHVFFIASLVLFLAAAVVWLAPRPTAKVDLSAAH